MTPHALFSQFKDDDDGSILLIGAMSLVLLMGLVGVIFDFGRLSSTRAELQSFADTVSLTAAAELDGRADAITRATTAADTLISDSQTFAEGSKDLLARDRVTLTFYRHGPDGRFSKDAALITTNPGNARFVEAAVAPHSILGGMSDVLTGLGDGAALNRSVGARAVASFAQEACNVAPVAVCLPSANFDASTSVGTTLELRTSVDVGTLIPGQIAAVDTLTSALEGLDVCAGLLGDSLSACLLAQRDPETACTGQGGLKISADVSGSELLQSINTRFDRFTGIAASLAGNPDFSAAPNVLTGLTDALGVCLPIDPLALLGAGNDIGLPGDDCLSAGGCALQGDGNWSFGRNAYVEAHYNGTDPHPQARTRFEFYQAEIAASATGPTLPTVGEVVEGVGGLLGGTTAPEFIPQLCAPQENLDPTRRLMVVAGIDCSSAVLDASVATPPVQQFFEVFTLGPGENGLLEVEITACLGGDCGTGNLDTEVVDVVRLVE